MAAKLYFTSDSHFSHVNILTFTREDGALIRPGFASVENMDGLMIARWNARVRPQDHLWHLGDLTMARGKQTQRIDNIMRQLNGHKRLILGNHDHLAPAWYAQWFEKVRGSHRIDRTLMFTHIPAHPDSVPKGVINVHGHTHYRPSAYPYLNISVERTDYYPMSLDEIMAFRDSRV